ncbi:low temperature requirement protein A [Plantibacter sp. YIM 135249]|uniref:low temperature requirement protein A n=1 Tax=Plantibacter sp. YIM 135249 TaxID=3423918 RepID=UPI003D34BA7D
MVITRLLRPTTGGDAHRVTFVELFFDLVFVFAITQISHSLIAHQDATTLLHTIVLTLAVWSIWSDTAWVTNWLNPQSGPVRGMLIVLMLLGLLMSSAIPEAFGDRGLLFACSLAAMQVGRSVFTMIAFLREHRRAHAVNFVRISIWLAVSGTLWITGALASDEQRIWIWLVAVAIDYAGPRARFWVPGLGRSDLHAWDVTGEHLAERVSLFVIIVLGESIIVTGSAFSAEPLSWTTASAFLAAFASTVLMWLLYFNHGQEEGSDYISGADERGLIAQVAYTYIPVLVVLGVLLTAVADEIVLLHPFGGGGEGGGGTAGEHLAGGATGADLWTAGIICGGAFVYLLGNLLFKRATGGPWLVSHLIGMLALLLLVAGHGLATPLALNWLTNLVLLIVVLGDERAFRRKRRMRAGEATGAPPADAADTI